MEKKNLHEAVEYMLAELSHFHHTIYQERGTSEDHISEKRKKD